MTDVNIALLEAKLDQIAPSSAIERLRRRVVEADDAQLFRVNPYTFAEEEGIPPQQAVEVFLRASMAGLLRPDWALVCRGCGEYAETLQNLCDLGGTFHCAACSMTRTTALDEHVEVGFTVHPEVRPIRFLEPAKLDLDDYFFRYTFSQNIVVRGVGERLVDYLRARTQVLVRLAPGEQHAVDTDVGVGWIVGSPRAMITVAGEPATERRTVEVVFDGTQFLPRSTLAPGPVRLIVRNASDAVQPVLLYHTPIVTYFDYRPFLSGQGLLNTEEFRRHLGTEVVRPGTGIPTRDNTLLFTDLRGSTALYDRVGDALAFELVSAHLESLARVITRHAGVVVKTIGDAVMASFSRPVDAARAALAMGAAIHTTDREEALILKIGIHRGPCLVVNVRDHVDYFGQTVNIAARVQHAAGGNQICMTAAVFEDLEVRNVFAGLGVVPSEQLSLRGVGEPWRVYRYTAP